MLLTHVHVLEYLELAHMHKGELIGVKKGEEKQEWTLAG
jgi:hypothetical protein